VRELEALDECEGTVLGDRRASRPYGRAGGGPGVPGVNEIVRADEERASEVAGKARFRLKRGDVLRIRTPGGGGWGSSASLSPGLSVENLAPARDDTVRPL
jgi:N-methylhydantoinase B